MGRVLVLSDIHANVAALEAVLRHAEAGAQTGGRPPGPIDGVWCLGDTVGYGPQPRQCVARLQSLGAVAVAGNHDRAGTGAMGVDEFNPDAATAALWTREQLSPEDAAYLDGLPEVAHGPDQGEFTLVHGTLRWPIWEYLYSYEAATAHLERQETPFGLVGHTHVPMLVAEGPDYPQGCELFRVEDGTSVRLSRETKVVVNPGGVGQPRDGDPRASYAVYDSATETVTWNRVAYDFQSTQKLMVEAGLPRWLIDRLAIGR